MRNTTAEIGYRAGAARHDLHAAVTVEDHRRGAMRPRVTVVEYGDFASPACRAAEPAVRLLLASYPDTVQLVFRHFPVEYANPLAMTAAEATEAAAAQGKFWEMHDLLLEEGASLARTSLELAARRIGLDVVRFNASMGGESARQRVLEHRVEAIRSHIRASPEFFVNGAVCDVTFGLAQLECAVRAALQGD